MYSVASPVAPATPVVASVGLLRYRRCCEGGRERKNVAGATASPASPAAWPVQD